MTPNPRRPSWLQLHGRPPAPPLAARPAGRRELRPIPAAPRAHRRAEQRRHRQGYQRKDRRQGHPQHQRNHCPAELELPPARQWPVTHWRPRGLGSREGARGYRFQGMEARRRLEEMEANFARRRLGREAAPAVWLATWRCWAPGRGSYPYATGRRPVGRFPRLGQVELRLGPAWVRYRETATPETGSPSVFHRPVMVPCRHRARFSRLRVMTPRCRPPRRCPPAARPTAPIYPARVRLLLPCPRFHVAGAVPVQPTTCSGTRPCALLEPAVPHRVAD